MSSAGLKQAVAREVSDAIYVQVANHLTKLIGVTKVSVDVSNPVFSFIVVETLFDGTRTYKVHISEVFA